MSQQNAIVKQEPQVVSAVPVRQEPTTTFTPRVDILETEDELLLFADVPGVAPDDLDLRFENGELILHGRCRQPQANANYAFCEYEIGDYYRAFAISEAIEKDHINAELKNGVLTVHLPKVEAVKPKRIPIKGD